MGGHTGTEPRIYRETALSPEPAQAFLLGWHPQSFLWEDEGYYDAIEMTASGETVADRWTVGGRKSGIRPGDRAFAWRYQDHRGLVASGTFTSGAYNDEHWDGSGHAANYADVNWDIVLHYDDCLPIEQLNAEIPVMHWNHLQGSGIKVKREAVANLADLWERHTSEIIFRSADEPA